MRFVWTTAVKDWRRHRRDPIGVIMWVGIPLLIGGLLTAVSGGRGGPRPQARVLVADADGGVVSRLLVTALAQTGGMIKTEAVGEEDGRARVAKGDATALLIIPAGFGDSVIAERTTRLELLTNPSQTILPRIVKETVSVYVDAAFYLHRLIGDDVRAMAAGPPDGAAAFPDPQIAELSARINQLVGKLRGYVFPPLIRIESVVQPEAEEEDNGTAAIAMFFLPGMLFMSLLFMAQGLSLDLWQEHDGKTLRRVTVSPQRLITFLAGKLLAGVGVMFLVVFIALSVGYTFFGIRAASFPLALVWALVSGAFLIQLMTIIQVLAPTERAGSVLTMILIFPLMMVGGSFFPFEAMPAGMAAIGKMTPNGWALEQFKRIVFGNVDAGALALSFAGLVVISSVLFFVSARRIKQVFAAS
jgi:ABC-type Na+ efflux pump permease subunit